MSTTWKNRSGETVGVRSCRAKADGGGSRWTWTTNPVRAMNRDRGEVQDEAGGPWVNVRDVVAACKEVVNDSDRRVPSVEEWCEKRWP